MRKGPKRKGPSYTRVSVLIATVWLCCGLFCACGGRIGGLSNNNLSDGQVNPDAVQPFDGSQEDASGSSDGSGVADGGVADAGGPDGGGMDGAVTDGAQPPSDGGGPVCGNGICETSEDCANCPADCGACPTVCGDSVCDTDENCWNCAGDCQACNCPVPVEVVIYNESAWNILADAFLANPCLCADYYLSIPALANDKTQPRASGQPEAMRQRGPRFHPMAEFHWGGWSSVPGSWYDKGVEFRTRMVAAGYDVDAGDTWAINELPSTVRYDPVVRANVLNLLHGLYDGPGGSTPSRGAVFIVGMGQATVNFSVYKPNLKDWIQDANFWNTASLYARWWAQEVYTNPDYVCVGGTVTGLRSQYINAYVEHVARLASVGPASANAARTYFSDAYVPLMNAVWNSPDVGYGNTVISLDQMKHHVSGQVYAARAWSNNNDYPDGRIGFAWANKNVDVTDLADLAQRLANSIKYAYDEGGGAASCACSPSCAYTWCQCDVAGAQFNSGWDTFATW